MGFRRLWLKLRMSQFSLVISLNRNSTAAARIDTTNEVSGFGKMLDATAREQRDC